MTIKPNIVIIMTDQQRADVSAREGFPLDTTPFLDEMAREGTCFQRAYTSAPVCMPARISMLTGRFPTAHGIRGNRGIQLASYERDLFDVATAQGYKTAMIGKNHSHVQTDRVNYWFELNHNGGKGDQRTQQEKDFDQWLVHLTSRIGMEPTPFPLTCQGPYRAVSEAIKWIDSLNSADDSSFLMWLSFAEPHNPYQVPEPYYSMFPVENLPPLATGKEELLQKGFKWQWTRELGERIYPDYEEMIPRARANYFGMLRLIDDQVKRFVQYLKSVGQYDNTIIVFVSDHGDFVGEYGLIRKGPELPEVLMRVPMFWIGPGISVQNDQTAFVSITDIMPTLCECMNSSIPAGVQGRSLWPLLTGADYPIEEFEALYAEQGSGGLHYSPKDQIDLEKCLISYPKGPTFNEVNIVSQSGSLRMLRKGDYKLVYDIMGHGELYYLPNDPYELNNLFNQAPYAKIQSDMLQELLTRMIRVQDIQYEPELVADLKKNKRNYWTQTDSNDDEVYS